MKAPKADQPYTTHNRRQYVRSLLPKDGSERPSLRAMAAMVESQFGESVTHATIRNDIAWLQKQVMPDRAEWQKLLRPEHFPEWRRKLFTAPGGGEYDTPKYQHAWLYLIWCFVFKERVPDWVLVELDLPITVNDHLLGGQSLLTAIVLAPPRHGKTELVIHAMLFIFCADASKRIIYCSGISRTSADNMGLVMQEMETNEQLIEAYGPFRSDDRKWSYRDGFFLAKSPPMKTTNVYPLGVQSNILSKDADLILVDDPQDLDAAESETTTARDFRWFTTNLMTRREPHTPVLGFGSHQPSTIGDLWGLIEESMGDLNVGSQKIYMTKMKAHDYEICEGDPHESCILWPTVRPYWFLEAMRASLGDEMFEVCYNQDQSMGKVTYFDTHRMRSPYVHPEVYDDRTAEWPIIQPYEGGVLDEMRSWKTIPQYHCRQNQPLRVAVGVDPAASEAKRASHTAIVVLAVCVTCKRRFVVDYLQVKQSPEKHPDTILSFVEAYRPQRVRIEKNAYQKALARDPRLTQRQGELGFKIDEWHTDDRKNDPSLGIPTLDHMIKEGRFSVPWARTEDKEYGEEFVRSFVRWPKRPNDIPMAVWLAELSIRELLYEAEYATPLVFDGWHGVPDLREIPVDEAPGEVYEVDMSEIMETNVLDVW